MSLKIFLSIMFVMLLIGAFVLGMICEQEFSERNNDADNFEIFDLANNVDKKIGVIKDRIELLTYETDEKIRVIEDRLDNLDVISMARVYDPNDPIYRYIPEAPADWTEKFGTGERTRLIHSISELRVVVAAQGKRLLKLEDPNSMKEPEEQVAK